MTATAHLLDRLVPISDFSHGGAGKAFKKVSNNNPLFVLKNNKPEAVIISPEDYTRLTEAEENFALYVEAMERMKNDDRTRYSMEDVFAEIPDADDGYEPEFE